MKQNSPLIVYVVPHDIMHHCPNCGQPIRPSGEMLACDTCAATYPQLSKAKQPEALDLLAAARLAHAIMRTIPPGTLAFDVDKEACAKLEAAIQRYEAESLATDKTCDSCGNPLEGEGNKSRLYKGLICDSCKDMES